MTPRVNVTFVEEDFAAVCGAAARQKMPPSAWAKSRLLMAAEREGFATTDGGERTLARGRKAFAMRVATARYEAKRARKRGLRTELPGEPLPP